MAMNEIRQQARKSAAERVARLRQQRADLVKKQEELSATVMTALAERDAVIADAERRAGAALKELASSGLSLARGSPVVRPRRQGRRTAGEARGPAGHRRGRLDGQGNRQWRPVASRVSGGRGGPS